MRGHLRANLWLLVLTVLLCSVLYPLTLLGVGRLPFLRDRADGSLVYDKDGKPVGSRLIGQNFSRDEYFWPRPSATSPDPYNAAASGASNYGANNPALRARVAQALGPIVRYQGKSATGNSVQKDIELWFQQWSKSHPKEKVGVVAKWAELYPTAATNWVKTDKAYGEYVAAWQKAHPDAVVGFVKRHPDNPAPKPEDMAQHFFTSYSREHAGTWPSYTAPQGKTEKVWQHVKGGSDVQAFFFDMWLQEQKDVKLEQVPADMVMASGSGLDPHITLKNALYQLDRVAGAWAMLTGKNEADLKEGIEGLLRQHASAPLGGLAGIELVNVLEVNLALEGAYGKLRKGAR